jgi:hypothetical protein
MTDVPDGLKIVALHPGMCRAVRGSDYAERAIAEDEQNVRAARAGIAARYERRRRERQWTPLQRLRAIRLKQLLKLAGHRGACLSDDEGGREHLRIMLISGLKIPRARELASWACDDEIDNLLSEEVENWQKNWRKWKHEGFGEMIGRRLKVIFAEKNELELSLVGCVNKTKVQVKKHYKDQRRIRDRARKRLKRGSDRVVSSPDDLLDKGGCKRAYALCELLAHGEWRSARQLSEQLSAAPLAVFKTREGKYLSGKSLDHAVERALKQLEKRGLAELARTITATGLPALKGRRVFLAE